MCPSKSFGYYQDCSIKLHFKKSLCTPTVHDAYMNQTILRVVIQMDLLITVHSLFVTNRIMCRNCLELISIRIIYLNKWNFWLILINLNRMENMEPTCDFTFPINLLKTLYQIHVFTKYVFWINNLEKWDHHPVPLIGFDLIQIFQLFKEIM